MSRIIVITTRARNEATGRVEEIASHGVCEATDRPVTLSQQHPRDLGARFCNACGEWVIDNDTAWRPAA